MLKHVLIGIVGIVVGACSGQNLLPNYDANDGVERRPPAEKATSTWQSVLEDQSAEQETSQDLATDPVMIGGVFLTCAPVDETSQKVGCGFRTKDTTAKVLMSSTPSKVQWFLQDEEGVALSNRVSLSVQGEWDIILNLDRLDPHKHFVHALVLKQERVFGEAIKSLDKLSNEVHDRQHAVLVRPKFINTLNEGDAYLPKDIGEIVCRRSHDEPFNKARSDVFNEKSLIFSPNDYCLVPEPYFKDEFIDRCYLLSKISGEGCCTGFFAKNRSTGALSLYFADYEGGKGFRNDDLRKKNWEPALCKGESKVSQAELDRFRLEQH